jgi:dihydroorotate dehydrogenase
VLSAQDALAKLKAGADVVQIYTGLIYRGPALVDEIARAFRQEAAVRASAPRSPARS